MISIPHQGLYQVCFECETGPYAFSTICRVSSRENPVRRLCLSGPGPRRHLFLGLGAGPGHLLPVRQGVQRYFQAKAILGSCPSRVDSGRRPQFLQYPAHALRPGIGLHPGQRKPEAGRCHSCRLPSLPSAKSDPCTDRPPTPSVAQEGFRCRQSAKPTAREAPLPATVPGLPGAGGRCSYPFSSSTCFHAKRSVPGQNDPLVTGEGEERPHLKAPPPPPESV